jgi:hypothetical protein
MRIIAFMIIRMVEINNNTEKLFGKRNESRIPTIKEIVNLIIG